MENKRIEAILSVSIDVSSRVQVSWPDHSPQFSKRPTQSAENLLLLMDRVEDIEVSSGTSSTTRSAENSSASVDIAKDVQVGEGDGGNDKTVKQSTSKKLNVPTGYFTSLHSKNMSFP